jgi:hypothetical protein
LPKTGPYTCADVFAMKDMTQAIKILKKQCSAGKDGLKNLYFTYASPEFKKIILRLFSLTAIQGQIPLTWKESVVKMIQKKNSKQ